MPARTNVGESETSNGYRIAPFDPDFATKREKADGMVRRYRGTIDMLSE